MPVIKYKHRRLKPDEFRVLLRAAGLSLSDFLLLSGRRRDQMEQFLSGDISGYTPIMADAMILELAALDAANVEDMMEIVARYCEGVSKKENVQ